MTTDSEAKAEAIANRVDCDHDGCSDARCDIMGAAIKAALDEAAGNALDGDWSAAATVSGRLGEVERELQVERQARLDAERLLTRIHMAHIIGRGVESTMADIAKYVEKHDLDDLDEDADKARKEAE